MMGLGPALSQVPWHEKLRRTLARCRGVRLGEATVVSRQVHAWDYQKPHVIMVLTATDAGEAMYGRTTRGEILHLDIHHDVADVDHHRVAAALRRALEGVGAPGDLLDYFDLVTGTGGGRVTGALTYGRKASLRAAHRNHVHLAGRLADDQLHLLLPLVTAVEEELRAQGVELRRVEKLNHVQWSGPSPMDLSPYTDPDCDSLLRGNGGGGQNGPSAQAEGGPASSQSLRSPRTHAQAVAGGTEGRSEGAAPTPTGWEALEDERRLQSVLELSRRLGSPEELKRVLDDLAQENGWASLYGANSTQAPFLVKQLEEEGLVRRDMRGLRLTDAGRDLADYLNRHLRDVKLRFRKLLRRMPITKAGKSKRPGIAKVPPSADIRYGPIRGSAPAEPGAWLGDLAVPETVLAALKRTRLAQVAKPPGAGVGPGPGAGGRQRSVPLRLQREDVHVCLRTGEQPLHICLLIDASASMAGRRILAAKHLARHLLASTRDRIAVIAFQERDVRVHVPFTRDYGQVENGLARIQPLGLTPLAHGLTQSLELIRASRVRRPLLLLITDGIPTVARWTIDPLSDALEAARQVAQAKIPFSCIGLQPSRRYLEELVRAASGTLHVVEELDEDVLVTIAHRERLKTVQRAR